MKHISRNIFIAGTLLIWLIKFGLRPWLALSAGSAPCFLMGIAPNLIGSFLIPFAACCLFENKTYFMARLFSVRSGMELGFVCVLGFILVLSNEYLQLIPFFGRTFDHFDILASVIGALVSFIVFRYMASFKESVYPLPRKRFIPAW